MSPTTLIKARPFSSLLLLAILLSCAWAWANRTYLQAFPDIVGAYTAKEYCSCRYVMDNPAEYCASYVKLSLPISDFFDDVAHKQVTASGLGRSHSAAWLGQRQGCQLLPQALALPSR
ncbi:MAG: amidase [Pseudomonas sp.]|uniref:amidase n=1 Tax=Pseudomonas sp. TaxID=306 RepID=UPI003BB79DFC